MKINFTKKEYRTLVEVLYLSDWMISSYATEDQSNTPHNSLRKKLLSIYKEMDATDYSANQYIIIKSIAADRISIFRSSFVTADCFISEVTSDDISPLSIIVSSSPTVFFLWIPAAPKRNNVSISTPFNSAIYTLGLIREFIRPNTSFAQRGCFCALFDQNCFASATASKARQG